MLHRPCLAALAAALVLVVAQGPTAPRCAAQAQAVPATASAPAPQAPPQASEDPYTVNGVEVDITAASAAEARDKAILEAQRKAFGILFKRLAADGDSRTPPNVSESELQRMMQGFEIEHERGSAVRYVGTLSFKFRRKAVRSYMSSLGIRVVEPAARPQVAPMAPADAGASGPASAGPAAPAAAEGRQTVVLPVVQDGGHAVLWEERTAWRSDWEDFTAGTAAAKLVIPAGELADIADIGAAEALAGDAAALTRIAGHYKARDVVVVTLTGGDKPDPAVGAGVAITRFGADGQPAGAAETLTVAGTAGEPPAVFLTRVVAATAEKLAATPRTAPPPVVTEARVEARVPIGGMQDWLEIRRRLTSNPMVTAVDMLSLSRSRVEVGIRYRGDQDALRAVLDRDALTLVSGPSGWTLTLKSSAQTAPAAPAPAPVGAPQPLDTQPPRLAGPPSSGTYLPAERAAPAGTVPAPGSQPAGGSEYYPPPADDREEPRANDPDTAPPQYPYPAPPR